MQKISKGKLELPIHVVVYEIFTRLSVKTVSRFRCVSKTWNFLISQPHFQKEHRQRAQHNPFVLVMHNKYGSLVTFSTYSEDGGSLLKQFSKIFVESKFAQPFYSATSSPIQSCLGLVCIRTFSDGAIMVLNPSTEEIITLPRGTDQEWDIWVGFGFVASTEEFKVVRFSDNYEDTLNCCCEVFTLGSSDCWRQARSNPPFVPDVERHIPFLHGALHLLPSLEYNGIIEDHYIAAFDVDSEEYREVILPRNYFEERSLADGCYLGEDRGSLCVIFNFFSSKKMLQLWVLKDCQSGNWVKGYNIILPTEFISVNPITITDDGNILLTLSKETSLDHELCCYSTQEKRVVKTMELNSYGVFYTESFWPLGSR